MHLKLTTRKVVHVGSESISEDAVLKIGMRFSESLHDDVKEAVKKKGAKATVIVIPEMSSTIPLERFH